MQEPDPPPRPKSAAEAPTAQKSADIVPLKRSFPPKVQPERLNDHDAVRLVRMLAGDSNNIVVVRHAKKRARQRSISRTQIERCLRMGSLAEGPFVNSHGHWQMNLMRHTAGEQITCVVAVEWATRLIVVTTF